MTTPMRHVATAGVVVLAALGACASPSLENDPARIVAGARATFPSVLGVPAEGAATDGPVASRLPESASGLVDVTDRASGIGVRFSLRGVRDVALQVVDGLAVYPNAVSGAHVIDRTTTDGIEDFILFAARPSVEELAYEVDVSRVSALRLVGNVLELLDREGVPRLRVAPPVVIEASGRRVAAHLSLERCIADVDPRGPWGRALPAPGANTCILHVSWSSVAYPALVDPQWTATGNMTIPRSGHTATVLASGKILLIGGNTTASKAAELYDPATKTFAATGSTLATSGPHAAVLLGASGKVLVFRGDGTLGAELYNPSSGTFAAAGTPMAARDQPTATALASGKILVVCGFETGDNRGELYDPKTNTFAWTGAPIARFSLATAVHLPSDKVLLIDGSELNGQGVDAYDPTTGTFAHIGDTILSSVYGQAATLLPSGKVLIAGGHSGIAADRRAEVFDPIAGTSVATATTMLSSREMHTATFVDATTLVIVGGYAERYQLPAGALDAVDVFDPTTAKFTQSVPLKTPRGLHTATLLPNNRLLVTGGTNGTGVLASAEVLAIVGPGGPCTAAADCASGFCVDGTCCSSSCQNQCQACDVPGALGTCTTIVGAPHASHAPCDGTGTACQGACDGKSATGCAYPALGTACGVSCAGNQENVRACDGAGQCAGGLHSCAGNLVCGASSCKSSCASDVDCVVGYVCGPNGKCGVDRCIDDATSRTGRGEVRACAPFRCDTSGACKSACKSVDDCVAPAACNQEGRCIVFADDSDRGCSTSSGRAGGSWWLLAALGIATRVARRKRQPRSERAVDRGP